MVKIFPINQTPLNSVRVNLQKKFSSRVLPLVFAGAAMLSGCSVDKTIDEADYSQISGIIQSTTGDSKAIVESLNDYFNHLGLLSNPQQSFTNIKTISFNSENGTRHYLKPFNIASKSITLK